MLTAHIKMSQMAVDPIIENSENAPQNRKLFIKITNEYDAMFMQH